MGKQRANTSDHQASKDDPAHARGEVRLRRLPLSSLQPAEYNPREITPEALAGLRASIQHFGLVQPIVWNARTGNVVSGHQRLAVLLADGVAETDVVVVDLDDADERALNVTQNNPAIAGTFTPALQPLLLELQPLVREFAPLRLDWLQEKAPEVGAIDLGDGTIDETGVQDKLVVFVPREHVAAARKELAEVAARYGGALM